MGLIQRIGNGIDAVIGLLDPAAQLRRQVARQGVRSMAGYKAARPRSGGGWHAVGGANVNDIIRFAAPPVRERVRDLARNFPYFAKAVQNLSDFTIGGEGIRLMSQVKTPDGKVDAKLRRLFEDLHKSWMDKASVCGDLHFVELQEMADRQLSECGEYLFIKRNIKGATPIPFRLQPMEPDRLSSIGTRPQAGNLIHEGIEYDESTGRRIRYWFQQDGYIRKPIAVPADDVIHGYHARRPGQLRGISDFAPGILVAEDLDDFVASELDAARLASKWLAFVTTSDSGQFQQLRTQQGTGPDLNKRIENLETGIIEYLRPGEDVQFNASSRPGVTFEPFVGLLLRMIAVSANVPYELLTSDYRGLNYSNQKGLRSDWRMHLQPRQRRHCRRLHNPVYDTVLFQFALQKRRPGMPLDMVTKFENYARRAWLPPGMESTDPLRESKAHIDMVSSMVMSPQEWCMSRGRDYEDVLEEIFDFTEACKERGLEPKTVKSTLASSPSALGAPEGK
jgi:lambda family phage portal protein